MQKTKFLVIAITIAAIIAATATTTGSVRPAFAKLNCNETITTCSGGGKASTQGEMCTGLTICNGGSGGRGTVSGTEITHSGGGGLNGGTIVGGIGGHSVCDNNNPSDCSVNVGGGHVK